MPPRPWSAGRSAIGERLERNEQTILFLNRRGFPCHSGRRLVQRRATIKALRARRSIRAQTGGAGHHLVRRKLPERRLSGCVRDQP